MSIKTLSHIFSLQSRILNIQLLLAEDRLRYPVGDPKGGQFKTKSGTADASAKPVVSSNPEKMPKTEEKANVDKNANSAPPPAPPGKDLPTIQKSIKEYHDILKSLDEMDLGDDPETKVLKQHYKEIIQRQVKSLAKDLELLGPPPYVENKHEAVIRRAKESESQNRENFKKLVAAGGAVIAAATVGAISYLANTLEPSGERFGRSVEQVGERFGRSVRKAGKRFGEGIAEDGNEVTESGKQAAEEMVGGIKKWYVDAAKRGEVTHEKVVAILDDAKRRAAEPANQVAVPVPELLSKENWRKQSANIMKKLGLSKDED